MAQPGQFNPGAGEDWIGRELAQLKNELRELKAANVFGLTGITPKTGGTDFDGYMNVNGRADFKGDMSITGTLSLPAGIIDNDALANPVRPGSAGLSTPGLGYTTAGGDYASQSIPVPAGFSQALVFLGVSGGAVNSTGGTDFIYVSGSINGDTGGDTPQGASAGGYGSASAFAIRTLTGLSGGFITVATHIRTGSGPWAANASNIANTNAIVQFLR